MAPPVVFTETFRSSNEQIIQLLTLIRAIGEALQLSTAQTDAIVNRAKLELEAGKMPP